MSSQIQQPNLFAIFQTLSSYQRSAALKGALDLDIFTHIAEDATTAEEIASRR